MREVVRSPRNDGEAQVPSTRLSQSLGLVAGLVTLTLLWREPVRGSLSRTGRWFLIASSVLYAIAAVLLLVALIAPGLVGAG